MIELNSETYVLQRIILFRFWYILEPLEQGFRRYERELPQVGRHDCLGMWLGQGLGLRYLPSYCLLLGVLCHV
jgi:hypothetical protein